MVEQLRALAVLKNLGLIPSIHMAAHNPYLGT